MTLPNPSPVHVYELPDRLFLHSLARTDAGFLLAVQPASRLPADVPDETLGAAVATLLEHPLKTVPTPARADYPDLTRPVLEAGGLKSWMTLERKGRLCEVYPKDGQIQIVPTENGRSKGSNGGFLARYDRSQLLASDASSIELGRAIRHALAASTGP